MKRPSSYKRVVCGLLLGLAGAATLQVGSCISVELPQMQFVMRTAVTVSPGSSTLGLGDPRALASRAFRVIDSDR